MDRAGQYKSYLFGGVRLNLPKSTWFVNCCIVTNYYSFTFHKALFFGYTHEVGGLEASMAFDNFQWCK